MDILEKIVAHKRAEVSRRPVLSLRKALTEGSGIIAEFKRKSPSKGWIHEDADPLKVIPEYCEGGASALSILTDAEFFGGNLGYIRAVRQIADIPILRKDFIIDPLQLYEAREAGADAVLLIAACLPLEKCGELCEEAHRLGLEVLLEIHSEAELDYVDLGADCLGVNNRNLGTFTTDVRNSFRLAGKLRERLGRKDCVLVSESGISSPQTVRDLRREGFRGFLLGEAFMKEASPGVALGNFIKELESC